MLVRPIIGGWEPPRIDRIVAIERRRLATLPVVGLSGDLHQDLGRGAMAIEISGSLFGDEARDAFLKEVRERFLAGEPVDFVADIIKESKLEQALIEELAMQESAELADTFSYRIVLREYTEPPEPPGVGDFGLELELDLGLLAELGLDMLDLPAITADIPPMSELLTPVREASETLKSTLGGADVLLKPLADLFGGP